MNAHYFYKTLCERKYLTKINNGSVSSYSMQSKQIKESLLHQCESMLIERMNQVNKRLTSIQESKSEETKSSAGDKFETGRAMMQIEENKCQSHLASIVESLATLNKINLFQQSKNVGNGSLVHTDNGIYFISIGIGKIIIDDTVYYGISCAAPIGKLLLGKTVGDQISFNNKEITILSIS